MIDVVAVITAHPGQREAILAHFRANVPAVLAEEGCIEYRAVIDAAGLPPSRNSVGPDTFLVIEKWASLAALRAHGASPHMRAFNAAIRDLAADTLVHILEAVPIA